MTDPVARLQALAGQCVLCGLCLPHCPTYSHDRVEGEGPRGRIRLAAALADGRLAADDPDNWSGLDHCLGCRRCEAVCPADVRYGELLVEARRLQRTHVPAARRQRLLEWITRRPRLLARALRVIGRLRPLLPRALARRLPATPRGELPAFTPARGSARGSVALFTGCIARQLDLPVHRAAIDVLTRLGWNVQVPPRQACCGALHRHAGAAADEAALLQDNRAAFAQESVHAVLVAASGCFESLRLALPQGPQVHELMAFVAADDRLPSLAPRALAAGIALHVPCTQATVVRAPAAAAALLGRIPGLDVRTVAGHGCCGAAGSHMVVQPGHASAIGAPLLDAIEASGAAVACSSNIGCRLHIQQGLARRGRTMAVRHPIELLAEALA